MKQTKKHKIKLLVFGALLGAFLAAGLNVNAQTKPFKDSKDATETAKPKRDWYPFYGTVASVDAQGGTISLAKKEGTRVLLTDAKTTFEQNGQSASLGNVKPGNYLHGKLHKNDAKQEVILDAKIELSAPAKGAKEPSPVTTAAPVAAVAAPVLTATNDTSTVTSAPAKKKKKKSATAPAQ